MTVETDSVTMTTHYVNERVEDVPGWILNRGPEYLRSRMMNRDSALFRHNRRSAVELLAETKPLYIRSDTPDGKAATGQDIKRSRSSSGTDSKGSPQHWTEGSGNNNRSQGSPRGSPRNNQHTPSDRTTAWPSGTGRSNHTNTPTGRSNHLTTPTGIRRSTSSPNPGQTTLGFDPEKNNAQGLVSQSGQPLPPPPPPPRHHSHHHHTHHPNHHPHHQEPVSSSFQAHSQSDAAPVSRSSPSSSSARLSTTLNKTQVTTTPTDSHKVSSKLIVVHVASCGDSAASDSGSVPPPPPSRDQAIRRTGSSGSSSHRVEEGTGLHKAGQETDGSPHGPPPAVPPRIPVKPRHLRNLQIDNCKYGKTPPKVHPRVKTSVSNNNNNENMDIKVNYNPLSKEKLDQKVSLPIPRSKDIPKISTEEWRDNRTDNSSDADQQTSSQSSFKIEESATVVRRRHRNKAISRSRSDLTKRYSNSSDFSELSARLNRNSGDLEKFFNEMGLDHNVLEPLKLGQSAQAQSSSSLNLFESVSCLGSTDARSCFSEDSLRSDGRPKPPGQQGEHRTPGPSSVVERNARIIKWLCNIKMASSTPHLPRQQNSSD